MYYGDAWATLSLDGLLEFANDHIKQKETQSFKLENGCINEVDNETGIYYNSNGFTVSNAVYKWFIPR